MSITKENLTDSVSEITGFKRKDSKQLIQATVDLIKSTLASGEDVMISGFGKFEVREKGSRRGRNSQTGEELVLDARRVVSFRPSGVLRQKLNGRGYVTSW